ncbi:MAG TPA: hypothetical protein PL048_11530 [Leptospiraceae bacterium]|nr:hypothetical protein [Leptospiraceae bacterium]HMY65255.1 hypothetical protein [Leptospiraceae bacterium]HMZ59400.1 hypothetical protein [Leptospiraceae bacterium]HNF14102.1 hypothetical protein [Leptospiraceae bacterium]HNF24176.1 hypothetical protein [Leptospiraceae bacterium]
MSLFTLFMFVLGLTASIYLLVSAMTRIISRKTSEEMEERLNSMQKKIDKLTAAAEANK